MGQVNHVSSVAECYAHALTIEREAVARYEEFAEILDIKGNEHVAQLFRRIAHFETEHVADLSRRAQGMELPRLEPWQYSWLDDGPPETVAHELVYHLMTPYDALMIALGAEQRAKAFFERLCTSSANPDVRSLAADMAREEEQHIAWIEEELAHTPRPSIADETLVGLFPH